MAAKPIHVRGRVLGGNLPLIIMPLVGKTGDEVLSELVDVLAKKPDIVEWRADFFRDIDKLAAVVDLARRIKSTAAHVPLLFTIRSAAEGGQKISITEDRIVDLHEAVCCEAAVDIVDFELRNSIERLNRVREVSRTAGTTMIMSYHNFQETPARHTLIETFAQAAQHGADVAKIAVMPRGLEDVLTLLAATLQASDSLSLPLISMSMGNQGALSRIVGSSFGSSATFAVGANSSAPGQMPIEELRKAIDATRQAMANR
ncbi:MAG TPA: type I 3-dehydroquinate dehydratase [Burkholderiales bacterium]|nr:type I 3-dehydroquinate dehydratase [Burkholderiales bacterium]